MDNYYAFEFKVFYQTLILSIFLFLVIKQFISKRLYIDVIIKSDQQGIICNCEDCIIRSSCNCEDCIIRSLKDELKKEKDEYITSLRRLEGKFSDLETEVIRRL